MTLVKFYDEIPDEELKFAVIVSTHHGSWVFCKHKERNTLEVPGGHRELGESIEETARRELYEETGAISFDIKPICVYAVTSEQSFDGKETFGKLFYAEIAEFEEELQYEMETVVITKELPTNWTYPEIQPKLIEKAKASGFVKVN